MMNSFHYACTAHCYMILYLFALQYFEFAAVGANHLSSMKEVVESADQNLPGPVVSFLGPLQSQCRSQHFLSFFQRIRTKYLFQV